nr:PREDICTED: lipase 1-like [Bemisia tabaci]
MYPPVYFQHGLLASSDLWLMRGPEEELAFQLALKGYDIWLSNVRGSTYSRNHTTLSPDEEKFWDFSWHEMGTRDLPAVIDFILAKTRQKRLFYIGHSMGTTQFYVMASARPEYNDKIAVHFSLAPICFMGNMRAFDLFHPFAVDFDLYKYVIKLNPLTARNNFELLPRNPQVSEILFGMLQNPLTNATFWLSIFSAVGPDLELINMDTVALFLGHGPNGVSERTLQAYAQLLLWGDKFNRFDYGPEENLLRYGLRYPPAYNLSAITAKVAIYFADNDYLSHPKDVQKLAEKLPRLIRYKLIKHKKFNHMDYIWGTDSQKHFAGNIIDTIRKYS